MAKRQGGGSGAKGRLDLRLTAEDRVVPTGAKSRKRRAAKRNPEPRRRAKRKRGLFGRLLYWGAVLGVWASLVVAGVIAWYSADLPAGELVIPKRPPSVTLLAASGATFATRGAMGGTVRLKDMPSYLPQAVLAVEDRRFYRHFGVDPWGLARAVAVNLGRGGVVQGGSTITQQLAKNLFLTNERAIGRKIQEALLAFRLERKYSKNEILETYLNRVYLGAGAYGVEAAAQRYFGKSARHVTLAEAAILAGLLKAPSRFAPTRDLDLARSRAAVVLGEMAEAGFISQAKASRALAEPISVAENSSAGNYAADWIMEQVPGFIGEIGEDIVVETTLEPALQDAAERALRDGLQSEGRKLNIGQGALVAMDGRGAVRALVGGRSYAESQFNRATQARRQPGSGFKPFVYLAALERGLTPETLREDAPISIGDWEPENSDRKYRGAVTLKEALALSLNTVAVRLGLEVGPKQVVRTAHRLGISSKLEANASIALGTSEVSLLELTGAYVPFANGGNGVLPYGITRIRTKAGRVLYARAGTGPGRVVSPEHVAMMNAMLAETLRIGTGRRAELAGWPAAGKTGTSQDYRDAWFVGYTAPLVCGVWLGNDDGTPSKRATGGSLPAAIWSRFMTEALKGVPVAALPGGAGATVPAGQPAAGSPSKSYEDQPWGLRQTRRPSRDENFFRIDGGFLKRLFGG